MYKIQNKIKPILLKCLKEAGRILKKGLHDRAVVHKKSELNLVTASDKAAEKRILEIIGSAFPDHAMLAEESPPMGNSPSRWIIDPLDGTTNFAHTFPAACVAIGYEFEGRMQTGGVYDPFRDELFFAERGNGAALNGKPIRVSQISKIGDALLATGFPYDRRERADEYLALFKPFMCSAQGIRRMGAAAIDLCYVACGRYDGFWELFLAPWDKAAALLILEEAGGRATNFSGDPLTLEDKQNLASNGRLHEAMLAIAGKFKHYG